MSFLYNIHTHRPSSDNAEGWQVVDILNTYPDGYDSEKRENSHDLFSCGIHPWYTSGNEGMENELAKLETILAENKDVVAVGEIGLDKMRGGALSYQLEIFKQQIDIAVSYRKPIIIHCVKCWEQLIALKQKSRYTQAWIIHGFRGNPSLAKQLYEQGFLFSIGYLFNEETVRQLPVDALFCETDTADVHILDVYKKVANARNIIVNTLASIIEVNIKKTFFEK